ncbi:ABC transporter ATP-binding protein [Natronomonas gomsonensis]|uniref:ABC transporter ATP-binding protein n=1 Tax=Natronomonas gomsonensis TaxID=1046043 RepID=UPI0015BAAD09|nr:ABC transporter ATP-binding protein [Natronomonas gomsonensis]
MSTVIGLREVRKEFGDVVAVEGIDLDISESEFFTILGPSGSGKTTVLRMIAGLETATDGIINLGDTDVTDAPPYNRDVNTVFQDYALFPHMTVGENIGYGLEIRGRDQSTIDQRVDELLELVSLPGLKERQVDELSGGQQQRVALARALAIEPRVLLLDEPLGALDEKLRREMQIELKEIQEELGTTFVYVTHDQEEALSMSDRIAVMDSGKVVQVGSPEEVYEQPRTQFIARFFRGSNIYDARLRDIGETVTLESLETEITANTPAFELPTEEPVQFFVRSENVQLGAGDNTVTGTIENVVYRGELTDYTVRIAGDERFVATLPDVEHDEGDTITLGWDTDDTVILHPEAK